MNRHVGASFTLSVLVVVFFAVILYEPEHARHPRPAGSVSAPQESAATSAPVPIPTPGIPLTEAVTDAMPEPVASAAVRDTPGSAVERLPRASAREVRSSPRVASARSRPYGAASDSSTTVRVASSRQALDRGRRSAFTHVVDGESLADVAVRVYGTSEAASALWRANRDIIDRSDASLRAGTLLRTP